MRLALTGATGFVGNRLLERALARGHSIAALTRRPQAPLEGVDWVEGSLETPGPLSRICAGADAAIHVAGVINAPDKDGFEKGNVVGTEAMLAAAKGANVPRFVHVSSLSAREPSLSLYGASKARSETKVRTAGIDAVVVRPPAVYGPGDRETLELFKMAKRGLVMLPPEGRLSLIHADDLSDLLLELAEGKGPAGALYEPDDGQEKGYSHKQFAEELGHAVGRKNVALSMPGAVLGAAARIDRLVRGRKAKLTPDRAAYFAHPDWVVSADKRPPAEVWTPKVETKAGLKKTADWYRAQGWI
ncbi:NAD-dependent epimerase/dehydratase family protein [Sphingomicrobium clamense]|uniref:NAD(P)H-binding protein n=1 Tax=Sphingomicrobium clamense TaxID=2851013 RepID=A0ABS6V807_9SPHN|nr:NAD-dependent epimerase/dehydratase family protein [Sphingomicrobium sp. B8]MBW0145708.1 NAD(P)H-binding protein [Sphingomicrobium sp. B8]